MGQVLLVGKHQNSNILCMHVCVLRAGCERNRSACVHALGQVLLVDANELVEAWLVVLVLNRVEEGAHLAAHFHL